MNCKISHCLNPLTEIKQTFIYDSVYFGPIDFFARRLTSVPKVILPKVSMFNLFVKVLSLGLYVKIILAIFDENIFFHFSRLYWLFWTKTRNVKQS